MKMKYVQVPLTVEKAKELLKRAKTNSLRHALLKTIVHYILCDNDEADSIYHYNLVYAQTVLLDEQVRELLRKSGKKHLHEALAVAVYHYLICPNVEGGK